VLPSMRAFRLGLLTALVYFAGTLYWITTVMTVYGRLPPVVAVLVNALLVAYLALFPALFAVVIRRLVIAFGVSGLVAAPFVWTAGELGRTYLLFNGFPWVLLGYSQATTIPIAQLASVFGVYGVSALVSSVSAAAAGCMGTREWRTRVRVAGAAGALVLLVAVWGSWRAARAEWTRAGQPVTVGLVQGNAPEEQRRDGAQAFRVLQDQVRLTRQAIGAGADIVLWSESSMSPYRLDDRTGMSELVRRVAREARVPMVVGSDLVQPGPPDRWYNAAFLVRADGTDGGIYRKMHLVPFGEYVPLRQILFFVGPLVEAIGSGFAAGAEPTVLSVDGHRLSVAICYEIIYPDLVRQFVLRGSELLTTITNDSWFGRTSAPYQHFAQASMRAIEEGRYVVRAANTGISGIVDPYGRVLQQTPIFEQALIVGQARYLQTVTPYARWGDVFAYGSVVITAGLLVLARLRPRPPNV
jgi:apolipoprotein N-acyltransferase